MSAVNRAWECIAYLDRTFLRRWVLPKRQAKNPAQHRRFIETARELECDEDKERFEEKLGQIARAKPVAKPAPKEPKSDRK